MPSYPRANEIIYEESVNLTDALTRTLNDFDTMYRISPVPPAGLTQMAFNTITAAFAHGVVIDKNDIRKQLRQTEELLKRCDEDKARLEEDIKNLHQELVSCQKISAGLEKLLSQYESHEGGVT